MLKTQIEPTSGAEKAETELEVEINWTELEHTFKQYGMIALAILGCVVSLVLGPQVILFSGAAMLGMVYLLNPQSLEKWTAGHTWELVGGTLGFFITLPYGLAPLGLGLGAWLAHTVQEAILSAKEKAEKVVNFAPVQIAKKAAVLAADLTINPHLYVMRAASTAYSWVNTKFTQPQAPLQLTYETSDSEEENISEEIETQMAQPEETILHPPKTLLPQFTQQQQQEQEKPKTSWWSGLFENLDFDSPGHRGRSSVMGIM